MGTWYIIILIGKTQFTSCGGTPKVMVRRSTFWYDSMHGKTKKIPSNKIQG